MLVSPSNGNLSVSPPSSHTKHEPDLDDTTDPSLRDAASQYSAPVAPSDGSADQDRNNNQHHQQQQFNALDTLTMAAAAATDNKRQSAGGPPSPTTAAAQAAVADPSLANLPSLARLRAEPYGHPSPQPLQATGPMSIASLTNPVGHGGKGSASGRKKKQCPTCQGWFSNLATHRSIHLADNSRPHTCDVCGRGFARPNDLFRHQKSHRGDAPFRCPLFARPPEGAAAQGAALEPACHQNGGFSRCDTYKNHLKAMHFEYPAGTKKRERAGMGGRCKGCGQAFSSTDEWIAEHIEPERCEGIKRVRAINEGRAAEYHHASQMLPNNFTTAELAAAAAGLANEQQV